MEIQLKTIRPNGWYRGGDTSLCPDDLRKEIHLPADENRIYAVFAKNKTSDSFRINAPTRTVWGGESTITGLRRGIALLSSTRWALAKAYKKGFRYVRIEY